MGINLLRDDGGQIAMMRGRLFSWSNAETFFHDRRGSATIWLIASISFVAVFLGVVFFLLKDNAPEPKPPAVQTAFKGEVREAIKPYTASKDTPPAVLKPDAKPDTLSDEVPAEKSSRQLEETVDKDPSGIQDVHPDDPAGKGILSQELTRREPDVSAQSPKPSEDIPPSPAEKPPPAAENVRSGVKEFEPEKETAKPVTPPEAVTPPEETSATSPEKTEDAAPQPEKENLEELVVTVVQGNVRNGPSVKEAVLFRIARGEKIKATGRKGNWYEIRAGNGRSGWAHQALFKPTSKSALQAKPSKPQVPGKGKKGVINGIRTVVTDPNRAQIIFELNGYYPPEIMVIEGDVPRVVCDFISVRLASGVKKNFPVKNGVVKRIRVGVHKGAKPKTRVVLDLNAGRNYAVEQFFFEKENYYALMVNSAN